MRKALIRFSLFFAIALLIGETYILAFTQKYWPLSADDYIAVIALLMSAKAAQDPRWLGFLMACWSYIFGNLYSMLFNRLDPVSGTGQRIPLLAMLVVIALVALVLTAREFYLHQKERAVKESS